MWLRGCAVVPLCRFTRGQQDVVRAFVRLHADLPEDIFRAVATTIERAVERDAAPLLVRMRGAAGLPPLTPDEARAMDAKPDLHDESHDYTPSEGYVCHDTVHYCHDGGWTERCVNT